MTMQKALKWSSLLVVVGLLVQLLCLIYIHPLPDCALCVGCPLVGAGIAIDLFGLLSQGTNKS